MNNVQKLHKTLSYLDYFSYYQLFTLNPTNNP